MTSDDENFFAWLDGELSGEEAAKMQVRVAADPRLAQLAEQHRAMHRRLGGAFDTVLDAPVPESLRAVIRPGSAEVIDFAAEKRVRRPGRWRVPAQWSALAATLAIGIFAGTMISHRDVRPFEMNDTGTYAAGALGKALDTQLASAPGGSIRVGLTFRDRSGKLCRSFEQSRTSGLACHSQGRWQLRGLFAAPEGQSGDYRMAAGMDPNLAALINSTMAGDPFDAAQEQSAKQAGWR